METTTAIEPSTQTPVDLRGLSDHERLYCLMMEFCDPATFRGDDNSACLFGQVATGLGYQEFTPESSDEFVIDALGLEDEEVYREVYSEAAYFKDNLDGALAMAREKLGIER